LNPVVLGIGVITRRTGLCLSL